MSTVNQDPAYPTPSGPTLTASMYWKKMINPLTYLEANHLPISSRVRGS